MEEVFEVVSGSRKLLGNISVSEKPDAKLCLILHAWNSNKDRRTYVDPYTLAVDQGYTAVRFDFSGNGNSSGDAEQLNYLDFLRDVEAVISFIQDKYRRFKDITIVCASFSLDLTLLFATKNPSVKRIISQSGGFGKDLSRTQNNERRENYWDAVWDFVQISFSEFKEQIKKLSIPIYLIHGNADEKVPIELAYEIRLIIGDNVSVIPINMKHKPENDREHGERLRVVEKILNS